ncbi:MAG: alpha/beta hydrolase [Verrucomicrobiae bacterium]|nr:alpha/beta hydrolase [Verrucomicrobiae bacterium]MCP5542151.1 alpha/beta hydrolase [Akkermansiaceae bacterium]MCP5550124.1 alpha/beta hydrolase [Akkermansiaceae bacterium]
MKFHLPRRFAVPLSIVVAALAPAAHAKTEKASLPGAVAEVYKKASGDDLWLYLFNPAGHDPAKDRRPAIVFFFGGGWNGGAIAQFEQHSRYLAARGMVAICADYRVKSRQDTTPRECVADGKSAIRWVRKNAARLGIDPDRIAAGGGSAGGHVAAATGMLDELDDPADADAGVSSKPNALVLFNPVYDNGPTGYGHDRAKEWFPQISPAHNITKDDPPAIVFLGTRDSLIPVATAEKFKADMEAAGVKSVLHLYEGQSHGFFNEGKGGSENFFDTVRKMDAFLVDRGFLTGPVDEAALKSVSNGGKAAPKAKTKAKTKAKESAPAKP